MYGNENYRKVKEEIESRRMRAIAEADARALELSIQNEEIRNIDRELKKTGLTLFHAACKGEDITPIREKNISLTEKREKVLLSLGLPTDYTEPKYTCPICSDTGYVGESMCPCMKQMLITENIKSSGMGKLIEKQYFDNFSLEYF